MPEIIYRELAPGFLGFDCGALRATLSPASCGDNFVQGRCLACLNCSVGKGHAGGVKPIVSGRGRHTAFLDDVRISLREAISKRCVRCDESTGRLIAKSLCINCYNRQREVVVGRNAKGKFPVVASQSLRHVTLLVEGPATLESAIYPNGSPLGGAGLPVFERIGCSAWLVSAVATGDSELRRTLEQAADIFVVDSEEGLSFLELYLARDTAH